jgi:hypothetical protein
MIPHDFTYTPFKGDLLDLINVCKHWLPSVERIKLGQMRVFEAWQKHTTLFPVRKFAPHANRGEEIHIEGRTFIAVDNEPLSGFYKLLGMNGPIAPISDLFGTRSMPASWSLEVPNIREWKKGGVALKLRKSGLMLAHLIDAAKGLKGESPHEMKLRFLLGFSPLNIFPFPDIRKVTFKADYRDEFGTFSLGASPSGDEVVQEVLRGFLRNFTNDEALWSQFCSEISRDVDKGVDSNWEYTASRITIETAPKIERKAA